MNYSNTKIETLNLSVQTPLGDESTVIERDNKLKDVRIETTATLSNNLFENSGWIATSSCYLFQSMYYDESFNVDEIMKLSSEEEKEYVKKIENFIEGYKITQVRIEIKTGKGEEGFTCLLTGNDDTKNTMRIVSEDGASYSLTLDKAKEQYLKSIDNGLASSPEECKSKYDDDFSKNLCLIRIAQESLNVELCHGYQEYLSQYEINYDYGCIIYIGEKTNNPSLCEKLKEEKGDERYYCYDELGLLLCDVSLCEMIPENIEVPTAYPSSLKEGCIIRANQRAGQC